MKKILSKILVFALVICMSGAVSLFAGCSTSGTTDYEHTIVFYSSQGDKLQTITENAIAAFEAKYPGWTVSHETQGGYDDVKSKIITDLSAGTQPDLAYCYPDHVAEYIQTGKVVDLNKFWSSTETAKYNVTDSEGNTTVKDTGVMIGYTATEQADFVETYFQDCYGSTYGDYAKYGYSADSLLTVPFVKSTELMYYNKTALDALGFEPADTWDELWAQGEKLAETYPTATLLGYDSESNWFITMCKQNGWGYTSADSSEHYLFRGTEKEEWLATLQEYYNKGYITTQELLDGTYTSTVFTKGVNEGGLLYCIGSSGGASYQDPGTTFTYGITHIPGSTQDDGTVDYSCISQGPSLVMLTGGNGVSNASEKEVMTWMFVKELLDATFQASFSIQSGYNSVRKSVEDVEAYKANMEEGGIVATAVSVATSVQPYNFTSPAFSGSSEARTQVGNVILYCLKGTKTPNEALADAYEDCGGTN